MVAIPCRFKSDLGHQIEFKTLINKVFSLKKIYKYVIIYQQKGGYMEKINLSDIDLSELFLVKSKELKVLFT